MSRGPLTVSRRLAQCLAGLAGLSKQWRLALVRDSPADGAARLGGSQVALAAAASGCSRGSLRLQPLQPPQAASTADSPEEATQAAPTASGLPALPDGHRHQAAVTVLPSECQASR